MKILRYTFIKKFLNVIISCFIGALIMILVSIILASGQAGADSISLFLMFFIYPFAFLVIVGIPISLLSDQFTKNLESLWRKIFSVIIHIGGVGLIMFLLTRGEWDWEVWIAGLYSFCYWLVDEWLK